MGISIARAESIPPCIPPCIPPRIPPCIPPRGVRPEALLRPILARAAWRLDFARSAATLFADLSSLSAARRAATTAGEAIPTGSRSTTARRLAAARARRATFLADIDLRTGAELPRTAYCRQYFCPLLPTRVWAHLSFPADCVYLPLRPGPHVLGILHERITPAPTCTGIF
jgi:hypothetical protein